MARDFIEVKKQLPFLGVGLGYRRSIKNKTLGAREHIDFLEVISEQYMNASIERLAELEEASDFQIIPHGVELSIGSVDTMDVAHLASLKRFFDRINAPWWSDHLSFTGADHSNVNSLLPLPFSKEAVEHVVKRVKTVQDYIHRPFLLENITAYVQLPGAEMTEAQFITEVLEKADCGMLLDVNNVYVNALNFGFDPFAFVDQLPLDRVVQIHIAGHRKEGDIVIDTHGAKISKPVYDLLAHVLHKTDVRAILLERDQHFPKFDSILKELDTIRDVAKAAGLGLAPAGTCAQLRAA
jgi:uncharacterized protein